MPGKLVASGFTTPDAPQLQRNLAQLKAAGAQGVVMEVSSHALHQGRVNGTNFDIAIFTNLTQDHLDYHVTFDAYEAAKARLFAWPSLKAAIVNRDDAAGQRLIESLRGKLRTIAYGVEIPAQAAPRADALLLATNVRATANGTAFHLASDWGDAEVEVGTLGAFNVSNLLAVLGALLETGVPLDAALAQIAKLEPVNGRMQRLGGRLQNDEPLVVIDYAHTPDALDKTLAALRPIAEARGGQLVCMFGCGGDRDATKRPLMGAIAEKLADQVVITSDNPRSEDPQVDHRPDRGRHERRVARAPHRRPRERDPSGDPHGGSRRRGRAGRQRARGNAGNHGKETRFLRSGSRAPRACGTRHAHARRRRMTMFTLREAAALIPGAVVIGDENVAFDRVSTDSRTARAGDLFVAVKGDRFDAHDFLKQVAERGASAALVSRDASRCRRCQSSR